jgi:hypothetical protein
MPAWRPDYDTFETNQESPNSASYHNLGRSAHRKSQLELWLPAWTVESYTSIPSHLHSKVTLDLH